MAITSVIHTVTPMYYLSPSASVNKTLNNPQARPDENFRFRLTKPRGIFLFGGAAHEEDQGDGEKHEDGQDVEDIIEGEHGRFPEEALIDEPHPALGGLGGLEPLL